MRWFISPKSLINGDAGVVLGRFKNRILLRPQNLFWKRADNVDSGVGVTHATVMRMVQPCVDRGHHIYFDNYHTSPAVLKDLSSKGFEACGTLLVNRKDVPPVIKSAKVKPGNPPVSVHHDGVTYISWTDKRQVNLATTIHDDSLFDRRQRQRH